MAKVQNQEMAEIKAILVLLGMCLQFMYSV